MARFTPKRRKAVHPSTIIIKVYRLSWVEWKRKPCKLHGKGYKWGTIARMCHLPKSEVEKVVEEYYKRERARMAMVDRILNKVLEVK